MRIMTILRRYLPVAALVCLGLFLLVTAWDLTFFGWFEKATLNPDPWDWIAGRGSDSFLVRLSLCIATFLLFTAWILFQGGWKPTLLKVAVLIAVPMLFRYSAMGIERFAPDYTAEGFSLIVERRERGETVKTDDVREVLGEPLVAGVQTIVLKSRPHHTAWLYSYMPSSGFGWSKRVFYFDAQGYLTDWLWMDEP